MHFADRGIPIHMQPGPTAVQVLPVLDALSRKIDALIDTLERGCASGGRDAAELEFLDVAGSTMGTTDTHRYCRAGNGPAPFSSSMWPVAKRDSRKALIRSGALPVATNRAQAAPEAGIALNPP